MKRDLLLKDSFFIEKCGKIIISRDIQKKKEFVMNF